MSKKKYIIEMNELGNTPADKNYKPSGIVNDLNEGQIKAVQLTDGTYITEKLAEKLTKSMTKAQAAAFRAFPGKPFINDRCVFRMGYEQAEKDLALTWEDIKTIEQIIATSDWCDFELNGELWSKEFYEEVLKRFKEARK